MNRFSFYAACAAMMALCAPAFAAGGHDDGHAHGGGEIGMPGDAASAARTIAITMHDNYYEPESVEIKEGETVRFVIKNEGAFVHEFTIATPEMHMAHAPMMQMLVDHGVLAPDHIDHAAAEAMEKSMGQGMHEAANSVLLEPGQSGEVIWTFPAHATLEFACNVPGHYEAGMAGAIRLHH